MGLSKDGLQAAAGDDLFDISSWRRLARESHAAIKTKRRRARARRRSELVASEEDYFFFAAFFAGFAAFLAAFFATFFAIYGLPKQGGTTKPSREKSDASTFRSNSR
ncbi:MAG: hypothetical protein ABUL55_01315 [Pseudomonadota bacterium]